jgi:hypothetical protein
VVHHAAASPPPHEFPIRELKQVIGYIAGVF